MAELRGVWKLIVRSLLSIQTWLGNRLFCMMINEQQVISFHWVLCVLLSPKSATEILYTELVTGMVSTLRRCVTIGWTQNDNQVSRNVI